jgi:1,4-dihydroxy-2-naphthoyl-CoA synthase
MRASQKVFHMNPQVVLAFVAGFAAGGAAVWFLRAKVTAAAQAALAAAHAKVADLEAKAVAVKDAIVK